MGITYGPFFLKGFVQNRIKCWIHPFLFSNAWIFLLERIMNNTNDDKQPVTTKTSVPRNACGASISKEWLTDRWTDGQSLYGAQLRRCHKNIMEGSGGGGRKVVVLLYTLKQAKKTRRPMLIFPAHILNKSLIKDKVCFTSELLFVFAKRLLHRSHH